MAEKQESVVDDVNDFEESSLRSLRNRWELASVLNFFSVFEPLLGKEVKMSAEEIENALINPNASLTTLHITLLKGIRPVYKKLSDPGGWVTSLCKKLAEWWPWVAEGEVPLTEAKGEEISRYKALDPTIRLLMLKALCEIRTMQDDLVSYVNDSLKQGAQVSLFRKDKIGQDRNGVSYWYDGNPVVGYRLYKEVNSSTLKQKQRGKNCLALQNAKLEWEVLATNLDEFHNALEKLSSCQVGLEAAVHETIVTEVIPVLEKIKKKKERDLKRRQKQEALLSGSHSSQSYATGITRSCRTRRLVKYTFDDFDRQINEAIQLTNKRKGREVEKNDSKNRKLWKRGRGASDGDSGSNGDSEEPQVSTSEDEHNDQQEGGSNNDEENDQITKASKHDEEDEPQGKDSEMDEDDDLLSEGSDKDKDTKNIVKADKSDFETVSDSNLTDCEPENVKSDGLNQVSSRGKNGNVASVLQMEKNADCASGPNLRVTRSPEAKNRYRQRPTRNSAIDSSVVPDSEDGSSSESVSGAATDEGEQYEVADSEDEISN